MKKTILLIWILALGIARLSLAVDDPWTTKADMPTARIYLSTNVVNGKIYAIGGASRVDVGISTVEEYDPTTDTWTAKSPMPTPRWGFAAGTVNGKIYAIGGAEGHPGSPLTTVEEYNPATDTWTTKSPMPTRRWGLSASVVSGKIYAIGGGIPSGTKVVEEYDPSTDTWIQKASIPVGRYGISTCAVNGKIYAIGGVVSYPTITPRVHEYNPVTDTWTMKANMLTARAYPSLSVINGKIYAMGGEIKLGDPSVPIVEVYDPVGDTWASEADMPTARTVFSTSVSNGKIYVIGGSTRGIPYSALTILEEYDPNPLVVDFNGDGIVDCADMCMMIDHWSTDEPLYDIGPRPFGDGIVDVQDLILLAEHLFTYPGAVAYWKLDGTEGDIAYDSVALNDAVVFGGAVWQPNGGQIDGALQFDGIDDYVSADLMLPRADAEFSVFAWVKGGMPGQVVFSQARVSDWLGADTTNGSLMTELRFLGKASRPLQSQTVITDGNWHRVGLVWDGSSRILYVDEMEASSDTFDKGYLIGGLQIGAGKSLDPGTFWFGLIDDVRIYDRAVTP